MITEQECVEAVKEAAERLGESPSKKQYDEAGFTPSTTSIQRVVGSWNEAKRLAELEVFEPTDGPNMRDYEVEPKPDWVEIPEGERWADLSAPQRWYYKNKQRTIENKNRRRKQLWYWIDQYRREACWCESCGEGHPSCLDFHHTGEKDKSVSKMIAYGYSRERILEEIEDCVVLCSNCHRKEHYDQPEPPPSTLEYL